MRRQASPLEPSTTLPPVRLMHSLPGPQHVTQEPPTGGHAFLLSYNSFRLLQMVQSRLEARPEIEFCGDATCVPRPWFFTQEASALKMQFLEAGAVLPGSARQWTCSAAPRTHKSVATPGSSTGCEAERGTAQAVVMGGQAFVMEFRSLVVKGEQS